MLYEYGKTNWDTLWEKLEQEGNVGLDYVINPKLYPEIIEIIAKQPQSLVVDFGCGTNIMGIQLLYGYAQSIPALKDSGNLDQARFNTLLYLGLEGQTELVRRSQKYLEDLGGPINIATLQMHIGNEIKLFDNQSVDVCVSRNFLMHLSVEEYRSHIKQVSHILKSEGYYIFATLNPDYEKLKVVGDLKNGEKYEFSHGKKGEYGTFYHYYKTTQEYESAFEPFDIIKKIPCIPITDIFASSHARYYDKEVPMAFVYVLKKIKLSNEE